MADYADGADIQYEQLDVRFERPDYNSLALLQAAFLARAKEVIAVVVASMEPIVGKGSSEISELIQLADLLGRSPRVRRLAAGTSVADLASEASNCLLDISASATEVRTRLLPKLKSLPPEGAAFEEVLDEIAEELRHIHYHIANTRLFNYVVPKEA